MKKLPLAIVIILVALVSFYVGTKYSKSGTSGENSRDFSAMRQRMGGGNRTSRRMGGEFLRGEVLNKDEQSITIKLPDGGSKIVFVGSSTEITKSITGTLDDLEVGNQVLSTGEENPDGSYTSTSIRLEPVRIPSE
ncbi:hypothetical protein K9M41_00010 [Candidatus Gracilibacteria bacterium]|nr:hypothetical protein [Candidatus Gracilibacteria bacterium]